MGTANLWCRFTSPASVTCFQGGNNITDVPFTFSDQAQDVLNHVLYMNMPGALRTATRIYRGATGHSFEGDFIFFTLSTC